MYSPRMRLGSKYILALACVSFLSITLSGFHLHVDIGGHDDAASHAHDVHQVVEHGLDHESEHIDISVFELARGVAKVDTALPGISIPEPVAPPAVDNRWSKDAPDIVPRRYLRLRPSLRAPPISI